MDKTLLKKKKKTPLKQEQIIQVKQYLCVCCSHKARACGQCFADLKNLDASVAKASLLPDDSDDEGSNVGSDAASQQGSVTDDRAQSSPQQVASRDASLCAGQSTEAGGGSIGKLCGGLSVWACE